MSNALLIEDEDFLVRTIERIRRDRWPLRTALIAKSGTTPNVPNNTLVFSDVSELAIPEDVGLVICDGLNSGWREVYNKAMPRRFVLYTSDGNYISEAKIKDIPTILKNSSGGMLVEIENMLWDHLPRDTFYLFDDEECLVGIADKLAGDNGWNLKSVLIKQGDSLRLPFGARAVITDSCGFDTLYPECIQKKVPIILYSAHQESVDRAIGQGIPALPKRNIEEELGSIVAKYQ
jgi:hypothetical protein